MRVIEPHSWYLIGEVFRIFIEEVFVALISLPWFQVSKMLFGLLFCLIKIVTSWRWNASIFLFSSNEIQIVKLAQAEVKLIVLTFLLILALVPRVLQSVIARWGQCFDNLDVIIHVKPSPRDVAKVGCFLGGLILSLGHLSDGILVNFRGLVFGVVPRNVSVGIVAVDNFGS